MTALSTTDLDMILNSDTVTKKWYLGAFPACILPKSTKKRYFFISNTDVHNKPGTHWTAWMVEDDKMEFFDSFGRSPLNEQFPPEFKKFIEGKLVSYSDYRVQKYSSSTCGYFCIYYIYFRSLGLNYSYIINQLKNIEKNDDIVISFLNSLITI